jgi:hypothetical protein
MGAKSRSVDKLPLKNCFFPPCTGQSAKLANRECHEWQSFVVTAIGLANLNGPGQADLSRTTTLGALSVLDSLDLYGNKLLMPTQLASLQALARLKLAGNTLIGAIPYNLGK